MDVTALFTRRPVLDGDIDFLNSCNMPRKWGWRRFKSEAKKRGGGEFAWQKNAEGSYSKSYVSSTCLTLIKIELLDVLTN